jgi:hypothetical protein
MTDRNAPDRHALGLLDFIEESNQIEGIVRSALHEEVIAHTDFLSNPSISVADLERFVLVVAAVKLRERIGMNVRVGAHRPPPGGPFVRERLTEIVKYANDDHSPYTVHVAYETLHPFMDGNGRSGRVLWAWMMQRQGQNPYALGFLHRWYYQSLDGAR